MKRKKSAFACAPFHILIAEDRVSDNERMEKHSDLNDSFKNRSFMLNDAKQM